MLWPSWGFVVWDPFVDAKPALDTFIALIIFPNDPTAAIPPALYTFGCMFTGSILARLWAEFGAGPEGQR